jgi:phosphatidylglycerol:prolipoprotein diacylglycerol transferase
MHPWLFQHPPISTYGTCIVVTVVMAWLWARHLARLAHLNPERLDLLVPLLIAAGFGGAWLFGRWTDSLTPTPAGGLVLVGAMLLGTTTGAIYALVNGIPLGMLGDIFAAPVALAIAGGRVGCFFAGCCYGKICNLPPPLALRFPSGSLAFADQVYSGMLQPVSTESLPVYATQLMESIACLVLAACLYGLFRLYRKLLPGETFLALGLGYCLVRFFLEFLRGDNPPILGPLTFSQVACIGIAAVAVLTLLIRRRYAAQLGLAPSN